MTLMDYCMQYIDEIMDGKRPAPEGITLTETDPVARGMELLQKVGDFPTLARLCAAQDGRRSLRPMRSPWRWKPEKAILSRQNAPVQIVV